MDENLDREEAGDKPINHPEEPQDRKSIQRRNEREYHRGLAIKTVEENNKKRDIFLAQKAEDERILAEEAARKARVEIWKQQNSDSQTSESTSKAEEKVLEPV